MRLQPKVKDFPLSTCFPSNSSCLFFYEKLSSSSSPECLMTSRCIIYRKREVGVGDKIHVPLIINCTSRARAHDQKFLIIPSSHRFLLFSMIYDHPVSFRDIRVCPRVAATPLPLYWWWWLKTMAHQVCNRF